MNDLLDNAFDYVKSDADFGADLFKVFTEYTPEDFDWVQTVNGWKWQKNTVNYDEVKDLYTKADVDYFISKLNAILNNILPGLFKSEKGDKYNCFLTGTVVFNRRADELFNTFYRIFGADFLQKIYTIGTITINGTASPKIKADPDTLYWNLSSCAGCSVCSRNA